MWELMLFVLALVLILMRRMAIPLLIILGFFYAFTFAGTSASEFLFPHNYSDAALVLSFIMIAALLMTRRKPQIRQFKAIKRGIVFFAVFFAAAAAVDLVINHDKFGSVVRVFRIWLPVGVAWVVCYLRPSEVRKFLNYLVALSVLLSIVLIVQQLTDIEIIHTHKVKSDLSRASVPWILSLFVMLLLLNDFYKHPWVKWGSVFVILLNIVMSGTRSLAIAYFSAMVIFFLFSGKFSITKLLGLLVMLIAVILVFSTDNSLSRRMDEASNDKMGIGAAQVNGTFSMRILLLYERMDYLNRKTQYQVFGIGFVQEKDFPPNTFKIGYKATWNSSPQQVDSGDIVWSPMFLRFGYVGTAIMVILFYIPLMAMFWKRRRNKLFFSMAIYLFLNVVLVSFTFSYIYEAHYFILPLLVGIFVPEFDAEFAQLSTRQEMVPMEVEAEPLNNIES